MSSYLDRVWAENGDKTDVPVDAQGNGSVSQEQGWTELYDRDVATDPTALSLSRSNMNGVFNKITSNTKQWLDQCYPDYYQFDNSGNPIEYKIYSAVRYNDGVYLSKVNNNTALPTDSTKWKLFQTLDFANEAEAIARTATDKWMNPFVTGKLIDNELIGQTPSNPIDLGDVDLHDFTLQSEAGFYSQQSLSFGTVSNNYPVNGGNWVIQVLSRGTAANRLSMIAINMNTSKLYIANNLGSWGPWTEIGGTNTDTLNPVGSGIISYDGEVFSGYIPAEGQAVSRTAYPLLFAKWGTKYGAGDGSTTFNVIDMKNIFARGFGSLTNNYNIIQEDAIRDITASVNLSHLTMSGPSGAFSLASSGNANRVGSISGKLYKLTFNASNSVPTASENRPINKAVRYLIKAS